MLHNKPIWILIKSWKFKQIKIYLHLQNGEPWNRWTKLASHKDALSMLQPSPSWVIGKVEKGVSKGIIYQNMKTLPILGIMMISFYDGQVISNPKILFLYDFFLLFYNTFWKQKRFISFLFKVEFLPLKINSLSFISVKSTILCSKIEP